MFKKNGWIRFLLLIAIVAFSGCQTAGMAPIAERSNLPATLAKPYVILVSLDGFRWDYVDRYSPSFLTEFRKEGTSAENMIPVYPSKTFTNHLSIITGLYAENHGIVANSFYDPIRDEMYSLSNRAKVTDPTWYGGEPLWVTAEKQGMLAATYFWPGSEAPIGGIRPSYFYEFKKTTEPQDQTKQVVEWLKLPEHKRPHFISIYFHHVDTFGPDSKEVKDAVLKLDQVLGEFYRELKTLNLPVNLVLVSDHGMQALDRSKVIYVEELTRLGDAKLVGDGPQMMVYVKDAGEKMRIYKDLKKAESHFKVYLRENLPSDYHLAKTPRAGDMVIIPEAPYSLNKSRLDPKFEAGAHGYDPQTTLTMRAIFYASGPKIKKHFQVKPFRNVNVFPFLAQILQLNVPSKMDGDASILAPAVD